MTAFTVYLPDSGQILRSGFVLASADAAAQGGSGEAVLVGERGDPQTQRVDVTQTPPLIVDITG